MSCFEDAAEVESVTWQMRLADWPRSQNRALVNSLMNGVAPYSRADAEQLNLAVNFNDLTGPRMAHDARRQFSSAFQTPASYFNVKLDGAPIHKRANWENIVTKQINKRMKRSLQYMEILRSTWANLVLHGIAPSVWMNDQKWCPTAKGVEDVLVPSNTLVSLENLQMFAVWESYTPMELIKLTRGPYRDKAWNMKLVDQLIEHAQKEVLDFGITNAQIYSPEKQVERMKEDSGLYAADSLATIDTWAFYFWNDDDKVSGWNKRVILDANWQGGAGGVDYSPKTIAGLNSKFDTRGDFLYNPGKRKYATNHSEIIHFQFGDLSSVGPFRYHSVRGLGYLLYAACNVLNRLRCKFLDSTFEQLQQYFRVTNKDDVQRALIINLIDKGFVDESVKFIPPNERWQINQGLAEMAFENVGGLINQNAAIYREGQDYGKSPEKTATQVMAEVNKANALIGAALQQAYSYSEFQYREIARRFTKQNSKDMDVQKFQLACLKAGVPKKYLSEVDCWEIEPEKTMGNGNKMAAMAIANQLMQWRPAFDPEPQREILKIATLAVTDDADMTDTLVPDDPNKVSDSKSYAQAVAASLFLGLHVDMRTGINHIEVIEALLHEIGLIIQKIDQQKGGNATMDEITGLSNMGQFVDQNIQILAQDPEQKARVKTYKDNLGKVGNSIKGYAQRLQQQMQAQAQKNGNGGPDPETLAKIQGTIITAKAKAQNSRESHAQKTAQRQTQWQMEQQRKAEEHSQDLTFKAQEDALELQKKQTGHALDTMHEVRKSRMKTLSE